MDTGGERGPQGVRPCPALPCQPSPSCPARPPCFGKELVLTAPLGWGWGHFHPEASSCFAAAAKHPAGLAQPSLTSQSEAESEAGRAPAQHPSLGASNQEPPLTRSGPAALPPVPQLAGSPAAPPRCPLCLSCCFQKAGELGEDPRFPKALGPRGPTGRWAGFGQGAVGGQTVGLRGHALSGTGVDSVRCAGPSKKDSTSSSVEWEQLHALSAREVRRITKGNT